jgi:hypothetical protein
MREGHTEVDGTALARDAMLYARASLFTHRTVFNMHHFIPLLYNQQNQNADKQNTRPQAPSHPTEPLTTWRNSSYFTSVPTFTLNPQRHFPKG